MRVYALVLCLLTFIARAHPLSSRPYQLKSFRGIRMNSIATSGLMSIGNLLHTLKLLILQPLLTFFGSFTANQAINECFNGKTIWITGASSGIGRALALELSKLDTNIIISSRSTDKLNQVAEECSILNK